MTNRAPNPTPDRQNPSTRTVAAALLLVLAAANLATAHPNHVSLADTEWNAKTGRLEVALKVHPNDLERALRRRFRRRVVLDKTPDIDQLIQKYLVQVFVVKGTDGKQARLHWVGKEVSVKAAWLYFELPLAHGPNGATFSNRILFELLPDQVNTINVRSGQRRASLTLTRDRTSQKLRLPDPKPKS